MLVRMNKQQPYIDMLANVAISRLRLGIRLKMVEGLRECWFRKLLDFLDLFYLSLGWSGFGVFEVLF